MKFAVIAFLLGIASVSHASEFKLFECSFVGPVGDEKEPEGVVSHQSCEARNAAEAELKMAVLNLTVNVKGQVVMQFKGGPSNQIVTNVGCGEMH